MPRDRSTLRLLLCLTLPLGIPIAWWLLGEWPLDPIAALIAWSGHVALILLGGSLAITPLARWLQLNAAVPWRKPLGITAGVYTLGHAAVYLGLDYAWAWGFIWQNISTKRHLVVAVIAAVLLVPLLVTSTRGWQRRLGARWKTLHRLVYPAAVGAGLHYLWLVKSDIRLPVVALIILGVLFLARVLWRIRMRMRSQNIALTD